MSEPQLDDPIALGDSDECKDCGNFIHACECGEPDEMYDEIYGD